MTRESAIERLKRAKKQFIAESVYGSYIIDGIDYAIETLLKLSEEHTEKCTETHACDCISRKAAIGALHDEIVRRRISEDTNDDGALDEFDTEAILRRLPSAQHEIIMCKDCTHIHDNDCPIDWGKTDYDFCSYAERRTDG